MTKVRESCDSTQDVSHISSSQAVGRKLRIIIIIITTVTLDDVHTFFRSECWEQE